MNCHRRAAFLIALLLCGLSLASAQSLGGPSLTNAFFAMDTATRDAAHPTPASQAAMLKELGYAGLGWSPGQIPETYAALDQAGLRMVTLYAGLDLKTISHEIPQDLLDALDAIQGRGTILWLYVTSKDFKSSDPAGDAIAVPLLRQIADAAQQRKVRVALYPHTWFWIERVQDAVRVARQVDRTNFGVTFNLCHCLKVGDEKRIPELLREAAPYLFVVSVNGADHEGDWDRLIQPLGQGDFAVRPLLQQLKELKFAGPIGFQGYGIKGDVAANLRRTMEAWRALNGP